MSADLFAAFGDSPTAQTPYRYNGTGQYDEQTTSNRRLPSLGFDLEQSSQRQTQPFEEDGDDDFGDFETASASQHNSTVSSTAIKQMSRKSEWDSWQHELDPTPERPTQAPSTAAPKARDESILFDAEDPDEALCDRAGEYGIDDDDFGAFEYSAAKPPIATKQPPSTIPAQSNARSQNEPIDLLDLETSLPSEVRRIPQNAQKKHITTGVPSRKTSQPTQHKPPPVKAVPKHAVVKPSQKVEDDWDDFETTTPVPVPAPAPAKHDPADLPPDPIIAVPNTLIKRLGSLLSPPLQQTNRPTTIPPPSVLIPLFAPAFQTLNTTFLTPLSILPPETKSSLLTNPNTRSLLKSYLTFATIACHVLSGRRHRWKRDKYLSQAMSIGPASGRSGLKITGVDRSESAREDQVAEECVRSWAKNVGRLKNIVAAANAASNINTDPSKTKSTVKEERIGPVPEMAEVMAVRVAKAAEGAVVGLHACALCGLKREERVAKVDFEVEDSFGEWWIEGVNMHSSCAMFWEAWKDELRGR